MQRSPETPSAQIDQETMKELVLTSRSNALERAGETEAAVKDVRTLQKQEMAKLLYGDAKGTDGAAEGSGDMELPPETQQALDDEHEERMKALGDAQDAYVFTRTDQTAAVQDDSDRSIGIAHDGLEDMDDLARRAAHEHEHREQEAGDAVPEIPETGVPVSDKERGSNRRLVFRENGSIKAEGGLKDHTPEYHNFVAVSDATAQYLNEAGANGDELVEAAGKSREGFMRLQQAMVMASLRKRLQNTEALAPSH